MASPIIPDAPIPNSVNEKKVKTTLSSDNNLIRQIVRQGKKMLEETNRPNVITLQQFEPYRPMFNADTERLDKNSDSFDAQYAQQIGRLVNSWRHDLGINLYEPTFVVISKTDQTIKYWLDRSFTRIQPDNISGQAMRDTVPAAVSRVADVTRDELIQKASAQDLMVANMSAEQKSMFFRARRLSAVIQKHFVEENLKQNKKETIVAGDTVFDKQIVSQSNTVFDDDDD